MEAFDRKEKLADEEMHVYTSKYGLDYTFDPSWVTQDGEEASEEAGETISIPYDMKLEYYISPSKKQVVQIKIDGNDSERANAVFNQMYTGMSLEEAEAEVEESGAYETLKASW